MDQTFNLPHQYKDILQLLDNIDPIKYGKTRNFIKGAVTQLSPYISRGVIDTSTIINHLVKKGYTYFQSEKFIQQLLWREYFQRVWMVKKELINNDLKKNQEHVTNFQIPKAIINADTGIEAIDNGIRNVIASGMMHNHLRMYVAFLSTNLGRSHWLHPAKWMYYYLLDGDWGSNALSWQWVAGTFSNKKYIANQENINYYTSSNQHDTYIDVSYETLETMSTPSQLLEYGLPELTTNLPCTTAINIDISIPTLIYNYYNLSPVWKSEIQANRILLLEPEIFQEYPVADQCIDFMLMLSKNIKNIQIFTGSFQELKSLLGHSTIYYKEHPFNEHYEGIKDSRSWIVPDAATPTGSFFSFWKKNENKLRKYFN